MKSYLQAKDSRHDMIKCKCTQYELDDCDVWEVAQICHSADFCGGKHAYELHLKDERIKELEMERDKLKAKLQGLREDRFTGRRAAEALEGEKGALDEALGIANHTITELEEINKNANELIGANSDELGGIIEKQAKQITELEAEVEATRVKEARVECRHPSGFSSYDPVDDSHYCPQCGVGRG
jgi:hypothetical protein